MEKETNYKSILKIVVFAILLFCGLQNFSVLLTVFSDILGILFPFLLGGAIAFIINVPMRRIEKLLFHKAPKTTSLQRGISYLITLAIIISILGLSFFVIIPQISKTISMIIDRIPGAFESFVSWLNRITEQTPDIQGYIKNMDINWNELSSYVINILKATSSTIFSSGFLIVSGILGSIINFVIAFIFSIYILFQKEQLSMQSKKLLYAFLSEKKADRIVYIGRLSNKIYSNFLSGQCIEAVILGFMFFFTLFMFKMPYALLIGVIIALCALIPIIGMFIGCAIGAFLIVMVDPLQALCFIIIFLVLQQIEGNLIYPNVVGSSVGLPPIWILLSVIVGGNLFGIAGILIFIPFCSVCYSLLRDRIHLKLEERNIPDQKWKNISTQLEPNPILSIKPQNNNRKKQNKKKTK